LLIVFFKYTTNKHNITKKDKSELDLSFWALGGRGSIYLDFISSSQLASKAKIYAISRIYNN